MSMLSWFALATLIIWLILALDIMHGNRTIMALRDVTPDLPALVPLVSVIVAARNESRNIRDSIQSLLLLDYPVYELIVVDDRSEDCTGDILDELAMLDPRLRVKHITELPAGWLGKNHALWQGANEANGTLFLFTDADIIMEPTTLSRAVNFFLERKIDHLAVSPSMTMPTTFLQMFGTAFIIFFSIFARPWKARDPKSHFHVGIGAFNMVYRAAYLAVGGHETIRLRPDDDIKLGKIIKKSDFRSDVAYGPDFLKVEWYSSLGEVIRGLEKNAFSGCDYRISLAVTGFVYYLLATVWPYIAIFITSGLTRNIYICVVLLLTILFADCASFHGSRRWYAIGFPICTLLFIWIILRTMVLNLAQGGIRWRGTFYSLKELKSNRI